MNAHDILKTDMQLAEFVGMAYLEDLSDADLMRRPSPGCNHINWQIGHLIASENGMQQQLGAKTEGLLPAGFKEQYSKETASSDDPSKFLPKAKLLSMYKEVRAASLALLEQMSAADLDQATGVEYAATQGAMFALLGSHWMMHAGQWVVVRRQLGRPALF